MKKIWLTFALILVSFSVNASFADIPSEISMITESGNWGMIINQEKNLIYVSEKSPKILESGECRSTDTITVIDGSTNEIVDRIEIDSDYRYSTVTLYNPNTDLLYSMYATVNDTKGIELIDTNSNEIISSINVDSFGIMVLNPETNMIFMSTWKPSVEMIDGTTNNFGENVLGIGKFPGDIAINPNTNMVYAPSLPERTLYVYNAEPFKLEKKIHTGDGPGGVTVNPLTNMIYTSNGGDVNKIGYTVSVIDGNSHSVVDTITLEDRPSKILVHPETNTLYVTHHNDKLVTILNAETFELIEKFELNGRPKAIEYNSNLIYITTGGTISPLSIIDTSTNILHELKNSSIKCPTPEERSDSYFGTYLDLDIIFAFILLGMMYLTRFTESRSFSSDPKTMQNVNVKLQMLFAALPVVWIWTLFRIKKIRKGLLLMLGFKILFGGAMASFIPFPYDFLVFFAIVLPIFVYVFRAWSIEWNEKLTESIRSSSGSQPI